MFKMSLIKILLKVLLIEKICFILYILQNSVKCITYTDPSYTLNVSSVIIIITMNSVSDIWPRQNPDECSTDKWSNQLHFCWPPLYTKGSVHTSPRPSVNQPFSFVSNCLKLLDESCDNIWFDLVMAQSLLEVSNLAHEESLETERFCNKFPSDFNVKRPEVFSFLSKYIHVNISFILVLSFVNVNYGNLFLCCRLPKKSTRGDVSNGPGTVFHNQPMSNGVLQNG